MRQSFSIRTLAGLTYLLLGTLTFSYGQQKTIPDFLREKQVWNEKLVVIYAPAEQQHRIKEQLNTLYSSLNTFKKEKIVVVQIPAALSVIDRMYLRQKLRYHEDRFNLWVIDEKGNLRMSSTKINTADQFLRVLNIETRPEALSKAQYFWKE
ncbi:DUF4174 domain-containing protein [Salmonirosea aquatica]|uniref:DUF4174 domain-containing protein n=1 Tax=Salmonirosea aquatica TaxID=2654236 RepID=A0A7C9F8D1_9BACT|nr:DUF4174 domain-containing protein [Cytophagaceae bacterium SJW1-29]